MKRLLTGFFAVLFLFSIWSPIPVEAKEIEEISVYTIFTYYKEAWTPSGNIKISADVTVQDSYSQIVGLLNVTVAGVTVSTNGRPSGIDSKSISLGPVKIWDGGSYATVTVTYKQNGTVKSEVATFYP